MANADLPFNEIDSHFASFMQRLAVEASPELELAAKLVSRFRCDGQVCLPLHEIDSEQLTSIGLSTPLPKSTWISKLRSSAVVGEPGEFKPLILDKADRLYLQRYWQYEDSVARELSRRASESRDIAKSALKKTLKSLFGDKSGLQTVAAFLAASSDLCVITGAPGTGKTRTIVLICALLLALDERPELKFALAAPTGKAAARLKESIAQVRRSLALPAQIDARLPNEASTIQRLLGARGDRPNFRHNRDNPLVADVVIVDEASMIDLALLAKLLSAIPPGARLILVGDKDQLAAVEAGRPFGDICNPGFPLALSANIAETFANCTGKAPPDTVPSQAPIHDRLVELRENYRFASGEAIAELSATVNRGNAGGTIGILRTGGAAVQWRATPHLKLFERELRSRVLDRFQKLVTIRDPQQALSQLADFAILCGLRRGPFGAEAVNALVERMLREHGSIGRDRYFAGQPLLVLRNDYHVELFNGDLGIVLPDPTCRDELRAFFPGENGTVRTFAPARLPEHETAFALTVHKSQGSEFAEALVILPDQDAPVLTRELVYTAVTRARKSLEVWSNQDVLVAAISRTAWRSSGLRDTLWGRDRSSIR